MDYFFKREETVAAGAKRIAGEEINGALSEIDNPDLPQSGTVHEVRKRCKKIRALLKLLRYCGPDFDRTYRFENGWFRDAAKLLAPIRDTDVVLETFDKLISHYAEGPLRPNQSDRGPCPQTIGRIKKLRPFLLHQSADINSANDKPTNNDSHINNEEKIRDFRRKMEQAKKRVAKWNIPENNSGTTDFSLIEGGFKRTYKRGRRALAAAEERDDPETWHEWRKRVKNHWYHLCLLAHTRDETLNKREQEAHRLSDLLGDDHDLAVLKERILNAVSSSTQINPETLQLFNTVIDEQRAQLQKEALPLGRKMYTEKPKEIVERFRTYWDVWKSPKETPEHGPL